MRSSMKPEASYEFMYNADESFMRNAYLENSSVTGIAIRIVPQERKVVVALSSSVYADMPWDEATIYQHTFKLYAGGAYMSIIIPDQIVYLKNKKIRVKIKEIRDGTIVVSRKMNMLEAWNNIQNEQGLCVHNAKVVRTHENGVFYDVGEGLDAFCYVEDYSRCWINVLQYVKRNEDDDVIITSGQEENYRLYVSRREASAQRYEDIRVDQLFYVRISEPIYKYGILTGYYCEITPNVFGIVDTLEDTILKRGEKVLAAVKKVNHEKGKITLNYIESVE